VRRRGQGKKKFPAFCPLWLHGKLDPLFCEITLQCKVTLRMGETHERLFDVATRLTSEVQVEVNGNKTHRSVRAGSIHDYPRTVCWRRGVRRDKSCGGCKRNMRRYGGRQQ